MDNGIIAIITFSATAAAVLAIVWLIGFIRRFNSDTEYYFWKMETADTKMEKRRWRREIRCHYLCLIPFVNNRNVAKLYNRIYRKKIAAEAAEDAEKTSVNITNILLPSLVGIFICAACLCKVSWAWFTSSTATSATTVRSASFSIDDISMTQNGHTIAPDAERKFSLDAGNYTLSFKKSADSTSENGFCIITVIRNNDSAATPYYTCNITDSFNLTIKTDTAITIGIEPVWGEAELRIKDAKTVKSGGKIEVTGEVKKSSKKAIPEVSDGITDETPKVSDEKNNTTSDVISSQNADISSKEQESTDETVTPDLNEEIVLPQDTSKTENTSQDISSEQEQMP